MVFTREIARNFLKSLEYEREEIVLFIGPRQAGKTTILKQIKSNLESKGLSTYFLDLEDPDFLQSLNETPKNLLKLFSFNLKEKNYIFVDEIQYLKNPTNFLKYFYDNYKQSIKLIVSGSSAFYIDHRFKDSLAGRKKIFNVHTLNFTEFLLFKGEERLSQKKLQTLSLIDFEKVSNLYHEYMVFGSYPAVVLENNLERKQEILRELAYSYMKKDLYESGIRDEINFFKLIKILSAQTSQLVNNNELAGLLQISQPTIENYLYVLQKSFHVYLIRPFYSNIRKELTKMPKVFFGDLGLRNFFTGDFSSWSSRPDKGSILENAVFLQLLDKNFIDEINFWRMDDANEVDFIIKSQKAYEVKSSAKSFKPKKYSKFTANYPKIPLDLISIDIKPDENYDFGYHNVWTV